MTTYYIVGLVTIVFAMFFFRVAESENRRGWLWGPMSAAIVIVGRLFLGWGYFSIFLCQILVYVAMTVANLVAPVER